MNDREHAVAVAELIAEMRVWRREETRRIELLVTPADEARAAAFREVAQTDPWRISDVRRWASVPCENDAGRGEAVVRALVALGWDAFVDGGAAHVRDPWWAR